MKRNIRDSEAVAAELYTAEASASVEKTQGDLTVPDPEDGEAALASLLGKCDAERREAGQ